MLDLVVLCSLVSVGAYFFQAKDKPPPAPQTVATARPASAAGERIAPPFELDRVDSPERFIYRGNDGPALITLTAVGCAGCQKRVGAEDLKAYEFAHARGVPVWNVFVYASKDAGKSFKDQFHSVADEFLADPTAEVSVSQYGGSDSSCWILLDKSGRIAWQGTSDPEALKTALDSHVGR